MRRGPAYVGTAVLVVAIAIVAFISLGKTHTGGTMRAQMRSWISTSGFAASSALLNYDAAEFEKLAMKHRGQAARHTLCGAWVNDAEGANSFLPTPTANLTQELSVIYQEAFDAAESCYKAPNTTGPRINKASLQANSSLERLRRAISTIEHLAGRTVATTTSSTLIPATTTSVL